MKILVFDIDGTLTDTTRVDGRYYADAVRAVLSVPGDVHWSSFTEFTDSAILSELCSAYADRDHSLVIEEVQQLFFAHLESALLSDPTAFVAVPGATSVFEGVRAAGWTPAIATGGWRRSAELKLRAAGIPVGGVPIATSTEDPRRADIIRRAVRLASPGGAPEQVVYVGDGPWDVRAARELGAGFLGRARRDAEGRLREAGAAAILEDFTSMEALVDLLADPLALVPGEGAD